MTQAIAIQELEGFLQRYRRFTGERTDLRLHEFRTQFGRIRDALQPMETIGRAVERRDAPRFNLFRLLGLAEDEVHTHSAVLADLLNPKGYHGQGFLFLKTFLEHCQQRFAGFPKCHGEIASARWRISKERVTDFGNIDLVVESPDLKLLVVIENKVRAKEGPSQLRRYADWMERPTSYYPPEGRALIFLTPNGREAESHGGATVYPLSYEADIVQWLTAAVGGVEAQRVRQTADQYLEVVKTLCKEAPTMNTKYETAVINYLAQKENLGMAFEIAGIFKKVLDGQQIKFWRTLERKVKERLSGIEGWKLEVPPDDDVLLDKFTGLDLDPVGDLRHRYLRVEVQQENADGDGLYVGVVWSETTKEPPQLKEVIQLRSALEEKGYDTKRTSNWWLGGKRVLWHLRGKEWCVRIAESDALEDEMADMFVGLFTDTKALLEKANLALAEIRKR